MLRSKQAVRVNVEIMRVFVRLRQVLATNADLARKLDALEAKVGRHDEQFVAVIEAIPGSMAPRRNRRANESDISRRRKAA